MPKQNNDNNSAPLSKSKIALICLASLMIGLVFAGFGFFMGYKIANITYKDNLQNNIDKDDKKESKNHQKHSKNEDNKHVFLVHTGLFSDLHAARTAWEDIKDYSSLDEKQAIVKVQSSQLEFYQVLLGLFDTKASADNFAAIISARNTQGIIPVIRKLLKRSSPIKIYNENSSNDQDKESDKNTNKDKKTNQKQEKNNNKRDDQKDED